METDDLIRYLYQNKYFVELASLAFKLKGNAFVRGYTKEFTTPEGVTKRALVFTVRKAVTDTFYHRNYKDESKYDLQTNI